MELQQLRCFVAVAEELHFGRAARRLELLPSALGRHIRLLEEDLSTRLLARTTRSVALTDDGAALLEEARRLLAKTAELSKRFRERGRRRATTTLRVGAIDTAAAGLMPMLLHDFRQQHPNVTVQLLEDKSIRLLPRLLSGRLDLAFVRPPERHDHRIEFTAIRNNLPSQGDCIKAGAKILQKIAQNLAANLIRASRFFTQPLTDARRRLRLRVRYGNAHAREAPHGVASAAKIRIPKLAPVAALGDRT
jgi:DNA-binding transcriptional LysR family regulator